MDPQQRLLLEVAWEALEHAGIAPDGLPRAAPACSSGMSTSDYADAAARRAACRLDRRLRRHRQRAEHRGRAGSSYVLGLQGPSLAVDTACSSSLVALHLACRACARGECELALAGGVNLMLTPELTISFSQARHAGGRRPLQDVRRRRPTATCAAKAAASSC